MAQTLKTNFKDSWRVGVGANYALSEPWTLKVGTAFDRTPVPNAESRMVSMPDNDRVWLSAGAQWRVSRDSRIDFGAARVFVKDSQINNNQTAEGRGTVKGSFSAKAWLAGAQYSHSF